MQGGSSDQTKKRLLTDLDPLVPSDHFLHRVQQVLDLSSIRALTAPLYSAGKGRPSIDPETLFRMILLSFFYRIPSDRQLCEHIHYNLLYRWFCLLPLEEKVPDHSSLTRFRNRLGPEVFQQFFEDVLKVCRQEGLLEGKEILIDSTLVHANASLKSFVTVQDKNIKSKNPKTKHCNLTYKSTTDLDATFAHKRGVSTSLKYKAHYLVDGASRLILDCFMTTGVCGDARYVLQRLEHIADQFDLPLQSVIADRAYGSARILSCLKKKKITSFLCSAAKPAKASQTKHWAFSMMLTKSAIFVLKAASYAIRPHTRILNSIRRKEVSVLLVHSFQCVCLISIKPVRAND